MRLKAAVLGGLALGTASVAPISLLAWLSLRPGFYAWLALEPRVSEALVSTAVAAWPRFWALLSVPWIDGPASLLMAGATIGGAIAVFVWKLSQVLSLDPGSLALSSLKWSVRNALHWRFVFLACALSVVSWVMLQIPSIGLVPIVLFVVWAVALPWQVIQPTTVSHHWIGKWWQTRRPSYWHAVGMLLIGLTSYAIAFLPWIGEVLSAALSSAALSHLLLRSGPELNHTRFLDLFRPVRLGRWLLAPLYVLAFALPLLGVAFALGLANISGLPVVKELSTVTRSSLPNWWVPYNVVTNAVVSYWWIIYLPIVVPWLTLTAARLANLEIAATKQPGTVEQ